jgi:hypothetical protein
MGFLDNAVMFFSNTGKEVGTKQPSTNDKIKNHAIADRDKFWGPGKLPTSFVHSTVAHPEKPENVTPEQLGKTRALAQQRKENAERFKESMQHYKTISDADRTEHVALRDFQNHEIKNHQTKVKANETQAALVQGISLDLYQRDRAFEAVQTEHKAMTDELNSWITSVDLN